VRPRAELVWRPDLVHVLRARVALRRAPLWTGRQVTHWDREAHERRVAETERTVGYALSVSAEDLVEHHGEAAARWLVRLAEDARALGWSVGEDR
jgi:hypothetical protein